jgi:DNA-binding NarL/FixJ family response regulator
LREADVPDLPHILIVDDSRVVRISLIKHLKDHFEIREESDGEAAWQTLVVDHSIKAVISDQIGRASCRERVS